MYRRLLGALAAEPTSSSAPPVPVGPDVPEDEYDEFLREVLTEANLDLERPTVTLADVGGLEDVKRRLRTSFLGPMRTQSSRPCTERRCGAASCSTGLPGAGRPSWPVLWPVSWPPASSPWACTTCSTCGSVRASAISTPCSRPRASTRRCVLFLDEVDALGLKRSHLAHSAGRGVVVQLLSELDSMVSDNAGVFVLGATNQPWDLDPASAAPRSVRSDDARAAAR